MKCIDCKGFYYKGGDYGYFRASGKTLDYDNEYDNCVYLDKLDWII